MNPASEPRTPLKLALLAQRLQSSAELLQAEPIAVVGIGCRFPGGADGPRRYWELLRAGRDAIGEPPDERFPADAFRAVPADKARACRLGGFVGDLERFDARFFGISPREARSLDPQQRLLLEVAWETLEHAGIPPDELRGSATGVFVGIAGMDYLMHMHVDPAQEVDVYAATGNAHAVAAGRLSYALGLEGPSLAIDTACSSSLVAVHLACQSLRNRECERAFAGGAHRILRPEPSVNLALAGMLAGDGRCKAFDADADGYVRGEGCGLVLLERLSDALARGDRVLALIRGSAVNQDGRSSGLTVPRGPAQQALIRRALACARVAPAEVSYVEAHGTGTSLGDPIEVRSLAAVLRPERSARPLLVGSVKTNLGHLEPSAGIAGLIKVVLALRQREIPPHLHVRRLNPRIPWAELGIAVPTAATPWECDASRIAGVSAFGFGGTNAHVVLEEAPELGTPLGGAAPAARARGAFVLALSARSEPALEELARRYDALLEEQPATPLAELCASANATRARMPHRLAVVARDADELRARLRAAGAGRPRDGVLRGVEGAMRGCVFLADGSQRAELEAGRELAREPAFERVLARCLRALGAEAPPDPFAPAERDLDVATFVLRLALAELWREWGVRPSAVLGRGVGEHVAACLAGVFSAEDALRLVRARARLRDAGGPSAEARDELAAAARIAYALPEIGFFAARSGRRASGEIASAEFWTRPEADDAGLAPAFDALIESGYASFVELGARGLAEALVARPAWRPAHAVVSSLEPGRSALAVLPEQLARLHARGLDVDWRAFAGAAPRLDLPTYPFERVRHWMSAATSAPARPGAEAAPPSRPEQRSAALARARAGERDALAEHLRDVLAAVSGVALADLDGEGSLLERTGIDSLVAADLARRLEADLGVHLSADFLRGDPSLDQLVERLGRELDGAPGEGLPSDSGNSAATLVPEPRRQGASGPAVLCNREGRAPPLVLVHPGAIEISCYRALGRHLGPEQPLLVFQPPALAREGLLDDARGDDAGIEELAAYGLEFLASHGVGSSFVLGGWSFGGLVAFEMALRLGAAGRDAPQALVLLDSAPGPARDGSTLPYWFAEFLFARAGRTLARDLEDVHRRASTEERLRCLWEDARGAGCIDPALGAEEFRAMFQAYEGGFRRADRRVRAYDLGAKRVSGRVVLVLARGMLAPYRRAVDTNFDWSAHCAEPVETRLVPGNHYSMLLEPNLAELARALRLGAGDAARAAAGRGAGDAARAAAGRA